MKGLPLQKNGLLSKIKPLQGAKVWEFEKVQLVVRPPVVILQQEQTA